MQCTIYLLVLVVQQTIRSRISVVAMISTRRSPLKRAAITGTYANRGGEDNVGCYTNSRLWVGIIMLVWHTQN